MSIVKLYRCKWHKTIYLLCYL